MIELVFVIVVLGILAAIAIPKFAATRTDAVIAKGRSDIASIRSGIISERQARLIKGDTSFISPAKLDNGGLFGGVLSYPVTDDPKEGEGHWHRKSTSATSATYSFKVGSVPCEFKYTKADGKFVLTGSNKNKTVCKQLVK